MAKRVRVERWWWDRTGTGAHHPSLVSGVVVVVVGVQVAVIMHGCSERCAAMQYKENKPIRVRLLRSAAQCHC